MSGSSDVERVEKLDKRLNDKLKVLMSLVSVKLLVAFHRAKQVNSRELPILAMEVAAELLKEIDEVKK